MQRLRQIVDLRTAVGAGLVCLLFVIGCIIWPKQVQEAMTGLTAMLSTEFGWLYLGGVTALVAFLIWLALSKYGTVRLIRSKDEEPEFSFGSWLSMLFAAGMGIGLMFWGVAEPMSTYLTPPFGEGGTTDAASNAMAYTFFHWGIHPWACFAIIGLALAFAIYRRGEPGLLSSCLSPLIGKKRASGPLGSVINGLAIIATVFGVGASLGMGALQVNSGLAYVFGVPINTTVAILAIVFCTVLFIISALTGLSNGIKWLSDINMVLMVVLLVFVFVTGSTVFLLNDLIESVGVYLQTFVEKSFWLDAFGESPGWLGSWTLFYWAWWISWAPFVGSFIARISRGRTVREFIFGVMLAPPAISFVFIGIMGGSALDLDLQGVHNVATAMGEDVSLALFALFESFPWMIFLDILALILVLLFFIAGADSATFVMAMMSAHGVQEPHWLLKVFWGTMIGAVAAVLLVAGGLEALQTASIAAAFPFIFVMIAAVWAMVKGLPSLIAKDEEP